MVTEKYTEIEAAAIAAHDRNIDSRLIHNALLAGKPVELPEGATWDPETQILSFFVNDRYHREGSPASLNAGNEFWMLNDEFHRNPHDGPAIEFGSGKRHWIIAGIIYRSQKEAIKAWDKKMVDETQGPLRTDPEPGTKQLRKRSFLSRFRKTRKS